MMNILWKRGEIAPEEQFLLFSSIFCNLILDFYVKTRTRFSLRDKRLFEITEIEITRVDCTFNRTVNSHEGAPCLFMSKVDHLANHLNCLTDSERP